MITDVLKTRTATGYTQFVVTTHSPILPDMIPEDNLYVCRKEERRTVMEPFSSWGLLGKREAVEKALDAEEKDKTPTSERIMRGDFDA